MSASVFGPRRLRPERRAAAPDRPFSSKGSRDRTSPFHLQPRRRAIPDDLHDLPRRSSATPRNELERAAWPVLPDGVIDVLRAAGEERRVETGDVLFEVGQPGYDLVYVEEGSVDIVERESGSVVTTIAAPNFAGELGMLMGRGTFLACEAAEPSHVIVVPQAKVLDLVATVPEVADAIVAAFAARRRLLIEWQQGGLTIVGREGDARTVALLEFASRNRIPHRFVDRAEAAAVAEIAAACALPETGTAVITGRNEVLADPDKRALADALGLRFAVDAARTYDLTVVGAGPGGLAAAVYGASEGLSTLVVEDTAIGGQAGTSSRIENYLGFSTGVSGAELAYQGEIQAVKFGARLAVPRRAVALREGTCAEGSGEPCLELELDDRAVVRTRTVVLANGVQYRKLPLERLEDFEGAGVYYAATELEARFCRGTDAVIVGGGNSAGQAAMFLSRHARRTHVVVRGQGLAETMSSYLSSRIEGDPRIELVTCCEVAALHGGGAAGGRHPAQPRHRRGAADRDPRPLHHDRGRPLHGLASGRDRPRCQGLRRHGTRGRPLRDLEGGRLRRRRHPRRLGQARGLRRRRGLGRRLQRARVPYRAGARWTLTADRGKLGRARRSGGLSPRRMRDRDVVPLEWSDPDVHPLHPHRRHRGRAAGRGREA